VTLTPVKLSLFGGLIIMQFEMRPQFGTKSVPVPLHCFELPLGSLTFGFRAIDLRFNIADRVGEAGVRTTLALAQPFEFVIHIRLFLLKRRKAIYLVVIMFVAGIRAIRGNVMIHFKVSFSHLRIHTIYHLISFH
jgi:hypothetical protein